ncbi:hypothetical protein HHI36_002448, partial [Cryptolaemus montrouzieri]
MDYTFSEYADMHLMYGLASSNDPEARRLADSMRGFTDVRIDQLGTFFILNI